MTDHKATPEQWADLGQAKEPIEIHPNVFIGDKNTTIAACLLELRARVEALEHRFDTQRLATLEWGKDVDMVKRWSDQHLQRIMVLEAAQPKQITQEDLAKLLAQPVGVVPLATASAGSLVERVSCAIDGRINPDQWLHQDAARAAIREVAAWLKEHEVVGHAARQLEKEADRG